MTAPTLPEIGALLGEVFPGSRIGDEQYLRWLYEGSPFGRVIETNQHDDLGLTAHYAVVPVELMVAGTPTPGALSLNTAVHERARGGGVFVRLATATLADAAERGVKVVIGVANANSTPGFERRLSFTNHGQLPVTVLLPRPWKGRGVSSAWSGDGAELLDDVDELLRPPTTGLARAWSKDSLSWRLAAPSSRYALHRTSDALFISTREVRSGVRAAVILAAFASEALPRRRVSDLVGAVCRFHRAPVALHVGHNERVAFHGVTLPPRFRPSPLNFISRASDDAVVPAPTRFEFLDFDAY